MTGAEPLLPVRNNAHAYGSIHFLHSVSLFFSYTVFRCSRNFVTYCLIVVNTVDRQAGFTVIVPATAQERGRARLSFPIPEEAL